MSELPRAAGKAAFRLSLDAWAVLLALLVVVLVRLGLITRVPW